MRAASKDAKDKVDNGTIGSPGSGSGRLVKRAIACLIALTIFYGIALVIFNRPRPLPAALEDAAIAHAAEYLVNHLDSDGRFEYLVRVASPESTSPAKSTHSNAISRPTLKAQYNVLRHAGAIYALAQHYQLKPEANTRTAIVQASQYLIRRHLRPIPQRPGLSAIVSLPGEETAGGAPEIKLGGCALGLVALLKARELDPSIVSLDQTRELGKLILWTQESSGRFRTKLDELGNFLAGFDSLYYPGEAILALALLHRADPDPRWMDGALRGARYLAQSREGLPIWRLPNDHWLMIAIATLWPQLRETPNPVISKHQLATHAQAIGEMMLQEQARVRWIPGWNGAFDLTGRITPSSTRIEGLQALGEILPSDHPDRPRIERAVEIGLGFILRAQVETGEARGGFTGAWPALFWTDDASTIRIDYVQHALSALVSRRLSRRLPPVNPTASD